jgi:Ca-activated chloride channel family protein
MIESFHFIRPHALWLLLPAALIIAVNLVQQDERRRWSRYMDPELLDALMVKHSGQDGRGPARLLAVVLLLAIVSLAGPAWEHEASPFSEDRSAMVIVIGATTSMTTNDLQPSRLARSSHKIRDLLELRAGAQAALIAYAGSAHLVMPLTRDADVIATFAGELSPELMPVPGNDVAPALALAQGVLQQSGRQGSILLVTDDLDPMAMATLKSNRDKGSAPPVILAAVDQDRSPGEAQRLREAADALGSPIEFILPDKRDIEALAGELEHNLSAVSDPEAAGRWRDAGYFLAPLVALLFLAWFRRGWFLAWDR